MAENDILRSGVAIEVDDFGTGQSSVSYLKYIPSTYVKITRSLSQNSTATKTTRL
jgi:EAL domain-containing protein (putative c-di-GMP-specific phosphodiesterase class I)